MKQLRVDYDRDYGIDRRTGWSVAVDGSYVVQFERFLLVALAKTIWRQWRYRS